MYHRVETFEPSVVNFSIVVYGSDFDGVCDADKRETTASVSCATTMTFACGLIDANEDRLFPVRT